jgi:hypothetical protein
MTDLDARTWFYNRLRLNAAVTDLVSETSIYGGGSITGPPAEKPFIVIRVDNEFREMPGHSRIMVTVWAHDEPGNYVRIGQVLKAVRNALCGNGQTAGAVLSQAASPNGIVQWMSDGPDQSDFDFGTLMKSSQYQLVGVDGNA